jgi:hypothetical protein
MYPLHKLGNANTIASYHGYYQTLTTNSTASGAASNAYLTLPYVPVNTKCINMGFRTGTLYNHKHVPRLTFPLCPQLDNALHNLSGCQHAHK